MLNVSADFLTAVKANPIRTDSLVMVDYGPELDYPFATVVASTTAAGFYVNQVCDGVMSYQEEKYVGNYIPSVFNNPLVGWKGTYQADSGGTLSTPETLEITYTQEHTLSNFFVVGLEDNYPVDFTIEAYDGGWSTLATVTNNDSRIYAYKGTEETFTKVKITITKISAANSYAQVTEAGAVLKICYTKDDLFYVDLLEEAFPRASVPFGTISSNTISVSLYNEDSVFTASNTDSFLYGLMRPKRRIKVYIGVEIDTDEFECVPLGTFWSEDWVTGSNQADNFILNGFDRLAALKETRFPRMNVINGYDSTPVDATPLTLDSYIDDVLLEASISSYSIGSYPTVPLSYAFSNKETMFDFLQDVSVAYPAIINVTREDVISIDQYQIDATPTSVDTWDEDDIIVEAHNPQKFRDNYSFLDVKLQNVSVGENKEVLKLENVSVPTSGIYLRDNKFLEVVAFISRLQALDTNLAGLNGYDYGANDITVELYNSGPSAEVITLSIFGSILNINSNHNLEYESTTWSSLYTKKLIVDNIYMQDKDYCDDYGERVLSLISNPNSAVEVLSDMNPAIEIGDIITVNADLEKLSNVDIMVLRQELKWDGTLSGSLYGRRID